MIRDSRHMHGAALLTTPEQVREHWRAHESQRAALGGFAERWDCTELEQTGETVPGYVSDSRWVADCPHCNGGIACWPAMPDGCCYDCGRIFLIELPSSQQRAAAEAVLEKREPSHRHWKPWEQDVRDLQAESARRGVDFTREL